MLDFARACAQHATFLDVSTTNAFAIQEAMWDTFEDLVQTVDRRNLSFRLQTSNSPVTCKLENGVRRRQQTAGMRVEVFTAPVLEYICQCSTGYAQGRDGICHERWTTVRILLLVLAAAGLTVVATMFSTVHCLRLRRRRRHLANDLDLHKALLEETEYEVVEMKKAWEIDWADVTLSMRIDHDTEGAFGEVIPHWLDDLVLWTPGCFARVCLPPPPPPLPPPPSRST